MINIGARNDPRRVVAHAIQGRKGLCSRRQVDRPETQRVGSHCLFHLQPPCVCDIELAIHETINYQYRYCFGWLVDEAQEHPERQIREEKREGSCERRGEMFVESDGVVSLE